MLRTPTPTDHTTLADLCDTTGSSQARRVEPRERGFTMIEVLVVALVLGILAGIAVPTYLTHKKKAYLASVVSDARNTGDMIEGAYAKDRAYPPSLNQLGTEVDEIKLSPGNEITNYTRATGGGSFSVCVVHRTSGTVDAYALYNSLTGGIVGKGPGTGPTGTGAACEPNTVAAPPGPVGPTTPPPTTGPTTPPPPSGGGGSTGDAGPTNVTATAVPGEFKATITWDAVTGADIYSVYLDGASTPAWSGTALSTELTGLLKGQHDVTVNATVNGTKTNQSDPAVFTIYGDNDLIANAHPVKANQPGITWHTVDYDSATATVIESGEPSSAPTATAHQGRWWDFTAPRNATYTIRTVAAADGTPLFTYPQVSVWESDATTVGALPTTVLASTANTTQNTIRFTARAGATYKVRQSAMSNSASYKGKFRLQVTASPDNDVLADAHTVTGLTADTDWRSADMNNTFAGMEAGEDSRGINGMWWTVTPYQDTTFTVRVVQASDGSTLYTHPRMDVWKSTTTDVTALGVAHATTGSSTTPVMRFAVQGGETYKIRASSMSATSTGYQSAYRLQITPGPTNDTLAAALPVGALVADQPWHSLNANNTYAGIQQGEDARGIGGMWWELTPTTTTTITARVVQASDGSTLYTHPLIDVWKSTTTDVTALGTMHATTASSTTPVVRFPVVAGETYKIRIATMSTSTTGYQSPFRLQITPGPVNDALVDATPITGLVAGTPWTSPDTSNVYAGPETGEDADGHGGMWWTITAPHSGSYKFDVIQDTAGNTLYTYPQIRVFNTTTTDVTAIGAAIRANNLSPTLTFTAVAGQTYKIRVSTANSHATNYRTPFRVRLTP